MAMEHVFRLMVRYDSRQRPEVISARATSAYTSAWERRIGAKWRYDGLQVSGKRYMPSELTSSSRLRSRSDDNSSHIAPAVGGAGTERSTSTCRSRYAFTDWARCRKSWRLRSGYRQFPQSCRPCPNFSRGSRNVGRGLREDA